MKEKIMIKTILLKKNKLLIIAFFALFSLLIPVLVFSKGANASEFFSEGTGDPPVNVPGAISMQEAYRQIAKRCMPAVVSLQVDVVEKLEGGYNPFMGDEFFRRFYGFGPEGQQPRERKGRSFGSGFLISKDGYLISNHHVVENAEKIIVQFENNSTKYEAKVVGTDKDSDVALLKIEGKDFPFLEVGKSSSLEVGDLVVAIGNPYGLQFTLTTGVISATGRDSLGGGPKYQNFLQTDVAINPGNSGGPLINIYGQVVGINSMIFSQSGGSVGIGFSIPIDMAKEIILQLKEGGKVVRGWVGLMILDVTEEMVETLGIEPQGVYISETQKNSPADKAGIKAGDIILMFNKEKVKDATHMVQLVGATKPNTKVPVVVLRKKERVQLEITVESVSKPEESKEKKVIAESSHKKLGLTLLEEKNSEGVTELVIKEVSSDSPFGKAGVKVGDIIVMIQWEDVRSIKSFNEIVSKSKKGERLLFHIKRGSFLRPVVITVGN